MCQRVPTTNQQTPAAPQPATPAEPATDSHDEHQPADYTADAPGRCTHPSRSHPHAPNPTATPAQSHAHTARTSHHHEPPPTPTDDATPDAPHHSHANSPATTERS